MRRNTSEIPNIFFQHYVIFLSYLLLMQCLVCLVLQWYTGQRMTPKTPENLSLSHHNTQVLTVSQDSELRGRQHPFKGTIVPDYGDLMLTKSTGIKNICRGKLGFLKFSAFYKGKHTLDQSDWAAVYKEKTVPRRMFLISMDSYHKILLVLGTIVRLEGCCRPLSSESQDTVASGQIHQIYLETLLTACAVLLSVCLRKLNQ